MKKKSKFGKYFLLSWRKAWIIVVGWFLAVILHNLVYGIGIYFGGNGFWGDGGDEPFFFTIATIIIPLYFIISVVYTLVKLARRK